jgi:hypothetical protein
MKDKKHKKPGPCSGPRTYRSRRTNSQLISEIASKVSFTFR